MKNKEKRIIKLNGGLGNQMFQYAFACVLNHKFKSECLFDYSFFEEVKNSDTCASRNYELLFFDLECKEVSEEELNLVKKPHGFLEKHFPRIFKINYKREKKNWLYDRNLIKPYIKYYDGYFQNEKYYKDIKSELLKSFTLKSSIDDANRNILNEIKKTNSVSVHIRRGDYVNLANVNEIHGTCCLDYYKNAIDYMAKNIKNPHFYLFSDDIEWVFKNIKLDYSYTVVDINQEKGYLDLELMKNCKNNIIANSSFSWWAAWLNQNPDKIVIAPKKWTAKKIKCDIVPKSWIKL